MGKPPPMLLQILLLTLTLIHQTTTTTTTTPPPTQPPQPPPKTTTPTTTTTTLDPKQVRALQSFNIPTTKDPCTHPSGLHNNATLCDNSKPFNHLISLHLSNCSSDISLSSTALTSLSTLLDLSLVNCPATVVRFPAELSLNLRSFTSVNSIRKLTGVSLGRLVNLTDLTLTYASIKASGPYVILGNLRKLSKLTISHANLTGFLPKSWHPNISYIDLSYNQLKGKITTGLTDLENLISLDLTGNQLSGEIPDSIGDLIGLKNLSLASNSLSGSIPESISSMPELQHIDFSSNQFNGTIPSFLNNIKSLKYLNLEKNNFEGVIPFNASFVKKLVVFKVGDNANLCYNHSSFGSKIKLGILPCDKNGLPMSPPASPGPSTGDDEDDDSGSEDETSSKDGGGGGGGGSHGPNKVVLGIAIALSSIVFLIIFLICLSRRCA